jgi:hypothetical protein
MSIANKFIREIFRSGSTKKLAFAGMFTLALAGSVALGMASRGMSSAAEDRDCSKNSIDYAAYPAAGQCGAADAKEFIQDVQHNSPSDLQSFYSAVAGLNSSNYTQFANTAVAGTVNTDGTVKVNGVTVMTGVQTYGRESFGRSSRVAQTIAGHTYYHSAPSDSFADGVKSLSAMVMFDDKGQAQAVVMNSCGNGVSGTSVKNSVTCKSLNATQTDATHKPNSYSFTTSVAVAGNAQISRVVYHFSDDNTTVTKTGASAATQVVTHDFTKDADVTVTVYASVPGGKEIQATAVASCAKHITFVKPFLVCVNLTATAINESKKGFRFTVSSKTDTTGTTTLQNVDFILDGKDTTKGVTTKDDKGNIYKEYTFTDAVTHKVVASLNFNTAQGVQSVTCEASVTPAQTPKCTVPGHENEAPNSPTCGYCQPNIPIGDTRCTPPPVTPPTTPPATLVNTGPGTTAAGAFVGTLAIAFFGRTLFMSRRARRSTAVEAA